jgi:hypothetical protein
LYGIGFSAGEVTGVEPDCPTLGLEDRFIQQRRPEARVAVSSRVIM